jgi:hypothetical protein
VDHKLIENLKLDLSPPALYLRYLRTATPTALLYSIARMFFFVIIFFASAPSVLRNFFEKVSSMIEIIPGISGISGISGRSAHHLRKAFEESEVELALKPYMSKYAFCGWTFDLPSTC